MRFQCSACKGIVAVENTDLGIAVQCGHCGAVVTTPESRVAPGAVIADFIIQKELGRGGMGVVYLAHQISLDRSTALKILADNYANDSQFVVGFIKEARASAKLNHPHIVQAYAVGEDEGIFYFAMEDIEGRTMKDILSEYHLIPGDQALLIIQQIAEALSYAWNEQKLIHRDIKPDNIMLTNSGRAKLSDLGLASIGGDLDDSESDEFMGTPQYISPEHLTGAPMDVRSDIYSLGATFYHFVTGRFPYEGATAVEIAQQHLSGTLIPPDQINAAVSPEISAIIMKMMARDPQERYQNADSLVEDIRQLRHAVDGVTSTIMLPPPGEVQQAQPPVMKLKTAGSSQPLKLKSNKGLTGTVPVMKLSNTASSINIGKQKKGKKGGKAAKSGSKTGLIVAGIVAGLLLVGGGVAVPLMMNSEKPVEQPKAPPPPKKTVFEIELEKVCAHAKYNAEKPAEILQLCEKVMTNPEFGAPKTAGEKEQFAEMLMYYAKAEEVALDQHRQNAVRRHEETLELEQQKRDEEAARIAAEKRKAEEAKRRQLQAAAEAKRKAEEAKRLLEAQKKAVADRQKQAAADFLAAGEGDGTKNPVENLKTMQKALESCLANEELNAEDADVSKAANDTKVWASGLITSLQQAVKIGQWLQTMDDNLDGVVAEIGGKKHTITLRKTKKGTRLLLKLPSGMLKPFDKLDAAEVEKVVEAVAAKAEATESLWLYYLLCGNTAKASALNPEGIKQLQTLSGKSGASAAAPAAGEAEADAGK